MDKYSTSHVGMQSWRHVVDGFHRYISRGIHSPILCSAAWTLGIRAVHFKVKPGVSRHFYTRLIACMSIFLHHFSSFSLFCFSMPPPLSCRNQPVFFMRVPVTHILLRYYESGVFTRMILVIMGNISNAHAWDGLGRRKACCASSGPRREKASVWHVCV